MRVRTVLGPGGVADVGRGRACRSARGRWRPCRRGTGSSRRSRRCRARGCRCSWPRPRSAGRRSPCPARGRDAVQLAAVGVAAPHRVDLGEVGVVAPVAAVDQRQQPGPVGARAWSRRPGWWPGAGRRARRRRRRRGRGRSCPRRARPAPATRRDGVVEHGHHVREGVPEEAADAHRDVDPRPAQLGERDRLQAGDPAGRLVPDRADAEQRQHLGDVVAGGPHRRGAPHRQPDRARATRRCRRGSARAASRPSPARSPRPAGTGTAFGSTE